MPPIDDIPDRTLPSYPLIIPRPFEIVIEPREFNKGGTGNAGAFFTLIDSDGDIFLQSGSVNGVSVPQADLQVFEVAPPPGYWLGDPDEHMYLEISGTGVVEDGVLLPGFDGISVAVVIGGPVPEHVPPTAASAAGTAYVSLGVFFAESFYPAAIGNINVTFCPGGFTIEREN